MNKQWNEKSKLKDYTWHLWEKEKKLLTQCGGLSVKELQQNILKDWYCCSWEGPRWHRAFLIYHLRITTPLQPNTRQVMKCLNMTLFCIPFTLQAEILRKFFKRIWCGCRCHLLPLLLFQLVSFPAAWPPPWLCVCLSAYSTQPIHRARSPQHHHLETSAKVMHNLAFFVCVFLI